MQLLLSGNPNLDTIKSAIYLINKELDNKVNKVHFLDNETSLYNREGKHIEHERNEIVRSYIPDVAIESTMIRRSDIVTQIPKLIGEQLSFYESSDLAVDLTNGDKYASSILYASSSFSKIENKFFITVKNRDKKPENLTDEEYNIERLSSLESLEAIEKYARFEITFYIEKIYEFRDYFSENKYNDEFLHRVFASQLERFVVDYFNGEYEASIRNIAPVVEKIAEQLWDKLQELAIESPEIASTFGQLHNKLETKQREEKQGGVELKGREKKKKNFSTTIDMLEANFCKPLRDESTAWNNPTDYQKRLFQLHPIAKIFDTLRIYRNTHVHGSNSINEKNDALFFINNFFYALDLIKRSGIFESEKG